MQVDPNKPALKRAGTKRLKLKYYQLLSNFPVKHNLRRYNQEDPGERVEAEDDGFPGFRSVSPAGGVSATTPERPGKMKSLVHKGEVGFGRNRPPCHRHAFCTFVS